MKLILPLTFFFILSCQLFSQDFTLTKEKIPTTSEELINVRINEGKTQLPSDNDQMRLIQEQFLGTIYVVDEWILQQWNISTNMWPDDQVPHAGSKHRAPASESALRPNPEGCTSCSGPSGNRGARKRPGTGALSHKKACWWESPIEKAIQASPEEAAKAARRPAFHSLRAGCRRAGR